MISVNQTKMGGMITNLIEVTKQDQWGSAQWFNALSGYFDLAISKI